MSQEPPAREKKKSSSKKDVDKSQGSVKSKKSKVKEIPPVVNSNVDL